MTRSLTLPAVLLCSFCLASCTKEAAKDKESVEKTPLAAVPEPQPVRNDAVSTPIPFNPWHYVPDKMTVQISTMTSYGSPAGEVQAKAARLGMGSSDFFSLARPSSSLNSAMLSYSQARSSLGDRCTNFLDRSIDGHSFQLDTTTVPQPEGKMGANAFRAYVERVFASNGLTIVQLSPDETAVILTRNLHKFTNNAPFEGPIPLPPLPR